MLRKRTPQLNVRISDDARKMFDEIEALTGLKDAAITHAFVSSLQKYWARNKSIKLPFEFADPSIASPDQADAPPVPPAKKK